MHLHHPSFRPPANPGGKIWQYMDMPKFVSMLQRKQLFFVKASKVRDPYEGVAPWYNNNDDDDNNNSGKDRADAAWRQGGAGPASSYYKAERKRQLREQDYRDMVLINSWHYNEYESAAMWQLYSQENAGIAIQSTAEMLSRCFEGNKDDTVWIGTVDYVDYSKEQKERGGRDFFEAFLMKRKSFEYENEIRAITCLPDGRIGGGMQAPGPAYSSKEESGRSRRALSRLGDGWQRKDGGQSPAASADPKDLTDKGKYVGADLQTLIENVYVAPFSEPWFQGVVESLLAKYGLADARVIKSDLYTVY
jgi:hypothetical protein